MKIKALIIFLFIVNFGCVPDNSKFSNNNKGLDILRKYPTDKYLTAIGMGETPEISRFEARSEIANIFVVKIESELKLKTLGVVDSINGEHVKNRIESTINTYSRVKLKGLQIPKTWMNNNKHHSIAVLDKLQAKNSWLREISRYNSMIESECRYLEKINEKILIIKPLQKIWNLWIAREVVVSRLIVIGFKAPPLKYNMKKIFNMIAEITNSLRIYVDISGKYANNLTGIIGENLSNQGFILTYSKTKADAIIKGFISVKPLDLKNPDWVFSRAKVSIKVIAPGSGVQVGEIAENVRSGHLKYEGAVHRAIKKISNKVSEKIVLYFDPLGIDES